MTITERDPEREALENFRLRLSGIEEEVHAIDQALARRDVVSLAHRSRRIVRATRDLLDKNIDILFEGDAHGFRRDLYDHLAYADAHIAAALSTETAFAMIEQRLYLAIRLSEDVLKHVSGALLDMEHRLEERDAS
ncbi:MAG: hypothetical protein ACRDFX_01975 [Chloroflexota bacterium]